MLSRTNKLARASLYLFVLFTCLGFFGIISDVITWSCLGGSYRQAVYSNIKGVSIIGWLFVTILGIISFVQIRKRKQRGKWMAVLSMLAIFLAVVLFALNEVFLSERFCAI